MSIETMLMSAFTGFKANNQYNDAKAQAQVLVNNANATDAAEAQTGQLNAERNSEVVNAKVATARTSFLNSGLTLAGTPAQALDQIYTNGKADTQLIINNANTRISNNIADVNSKSKSLVNTGRANAINTIVQSFGNAGIGSSGSMGSMFDTALSKLPASASFAANNAGFGNDAFNALSMSDAAMGA